MTRRSQDKGATDPATVEAKKQLDAATALRSTFQTGETLRGLLLTTYGFSIFGDKAGLAALICFITAALIAVLSAAGFVHAFMTKPDRWCWAAASSRSTARVPVTASKTPRGLAACAAHEAFSRLNYRKNWKKRTPASNGGGSAVSRCEPTR